MDDVVQQPVQLVADSAPSSPCTPSPGLISILAVLFRAFLNGTDFTGKENCLSMLLCTTVWITCVKVRRACAQIGEMLGIPLPE